ncbi:MAG: SdrD B-like domain-containing protein, partial [Burkholderiaceae bacterium]
GVGPRLRWTVAATMAPAAEHTLRYRVRIGTGALQGDGVNRAQATAEAPDAVISNVATAAVKVEAGVFSDRAFVMGTVFADCNANGVKDADEPGVPGVRLWMEDGTSVTTDSAGRYSLYGLTPRTHVLKLDPVTLPEGATPLATSQRHAGDGGSRFVDPHAGELQRADFALGGCSAAMRAAIDLRIQSAARLGDEATASLRTALSTTATAAAQDLRALPASGRVGEPLSAGTAPAATPQAAAASAAPSPAAVEDVSAPLPRFVGLREGQILASSAATVRVAGHLGATMSLRLNGEAVGDDRIGERARDTGDQTESRAYIGLPLKAGVNTLTLTEHDAFGQLRATRELRVAVPGDLARIVIDAPASVDAGAPATLKLRFEDAQGLPMPSRLPVTLSGPGRWAVDDLDPRSADVQSFVEGGAAALGWQAADAPGEARVRVASGGVSAEARIAVVAALRPMLAVGIVDAALNLRRLKVGQVQSAAAGDGFESELRAFASSADRQGTDARGAVFLKGKVRGDALLTLAYDSDKNTRERLFRDIQPDAFYPVYGDASTKGFDAQSTGKLYVRIDRNQSSLLYGDFTTQTDDPARQLGAYQRSLNGIKHHVELGGVRANAFAARDTTRQAVIELRGNGTSGPYAMEGNAVENSEKVELIVRDRDQPALIVSTTALARFADYDFEPLTGRLLMRAPVPSVDRNLNPVSLRVSYEIDQGGAAFWVAGADAQWQATEALQVGGALVRDWNPMAPMQMGSANARLKLAERTEVSAEVARVSRGDAVADAAAAHAGNGGRVALSHDGETLKARAHAARTDVGFDNRSALINSGRSEGGAQVAYMVDERTRLVGEALYTADVKSGAERVGVLARVERTLEGGAKIELGARRVSQHGAGAAGTDGANAGDTTTLRAKATAPIPGLPTASVYVEGEQDVRDNGKRLLAVGGDYQLQGSGRLYARHELISSLTGPYALDPSTRRNTTVIGIDGAAGVGGGEGRMFSEYRGREAFDGRQTEAAIGLRNQWMLRPGLRLNASLERVQPLQRGQAAGGAPATDSESAAVTGAVEYTADPRWKGTARLELRGAPGTTGVLSTLGLAYKLDDRWTLLGKNVLAGTVNRGATADRWQERLQLGTAFRDDASRLNALGRYEYKDERGTVADAEARRAHIVSVHAERQLDRGLDVTGRYAAKRVIETVGGARTRSAAQLGSVRVTKDIGDRWDVGAGVSVMGDARLRSRQMSYGVEAGYRVKDNLWVSVGYNVAGYKDRDLTADDATARGVYLRLRFKFDEKLLSGLSS